MLRVALRGLWGRKLRAVLTAIAIVLGVAMVSGTLSLTHAIDSAFKEIFDDTYAQTDAVVSGKTFNYQGDTSQPPSIPADLLGKVRRLPGTDVAAGVVSDQTSAKIINRKGKAIDTGGAPSFGFGVDTAPQVQRFNPLKLLEGRWARDADEVVIDTHTADDQHFKLGDMVGVASLHPVKKFKLVGIARYGNVDSIGGATFAVFTIPTAQALFNRQNAYDEISVAAKQGTSPQELVDQIKPLVPANAQVRTGAQEAKKQTDDVTSFTKFIRYFLLAFAGIALFVGAFVIFNTLSITVAQRTREFATLRTIGASRRQILRSVIAEAVVVGALASIVGLVLGLALANLLKWLADRGGGGIPTQSLSLSLSIVFWGFVVGVGVTVLASLAPAFRATKVPPIAAVREGAVLPRSRLAPFAPWIAGALSLIALGLLGYSMFASSSSLGTGLRLLYMGVGVLLLFTGVALLSPRLVRPLASVTHYVAIAATWFFLLIVYPVALAFWLLRYAVFGAHRPAGRRLGAFAAGLVPGVLLLALLGGGPFGVVALIFLPALVLIMWLRTLVTRWRPEWPMEFPNLRIDRQMTRVARENARRNPGRTAATAAALMIGLALVTFVGTLANGMKESNRGAIEDQVKAEYIQTSTDGFTPFVAAAGDAIAKAPSVETASQVRYDLAKIAGSAQYLSGVDPATISRVYHFDWKTGSNATLNELGANGAVVDKKFADQKHLKVGDTFPISVSGGPSSTAVVKGIYRAPPFFPILGAASISVPAFDRLYQRPRNEYTFLNVKGTPSDATRQQLEQAVGEFPDSKVQSRADWITAQDQDFNDFLTFLYVLLALSVIVSLFGMVNTLALSVYERTRELGMLRAVGTTRRQARRMIRHEGVITALIGAALGIPLGLFLALLVTKALSQFDVRYAIPVTTLVLFACIAVVAGLVAALLPARRAARLNVLEALQYE
ncbi:MAG TPA: FtsX-like permease family protein [Gaiellaceae bacterium]|nr:FtsX-like permease family protein [Gaiellaceae bacterium]